jgi:hypothetical protein
MRITLAVALLLAGAATAAQADELTGLSLDDLRSVSPRIERDTRIKTEGASSVKITADWPTTVSLGEISDLDIEDATLIYRAKVRTDLEGTGSAYLELWAHVDGGQYFSRGTDDSARGSSDWMVLETPFLFRKGQRPSRVTLNLVVNGKGTVWIDDLVLSRESRK